LTPGIKRESADFGLTVVLKSLVERI
jgi:hypothetical protein